MEIIDKQHIKYSYKKNKEQELNPILELYRGKVYAYILKSFIFNCTDNLGSKIFSIKKSYPRTITNLLSSWFFTLYSTYDFSEDPFFPSNYENIKPLEDTLTDFAKYDPTIENVEEKINKITTSLKKTYKEAMENLNDYKNSDYYKEKKSFYKTSKSIVYQTRHNNNITFYKFSITYPFKLRDKRQENIINNILIPKYIFDKLEKRYTGPEDKLNDYLWIIIYRYQLLGSNNNQLAVLPHILMKMNLDFGLSFECFASSINSTFDDYCSIYYDVEKYFGSKGNFFNLVPLEGTFGFNPPYQKNVMDSGIFRLLDLLDLATKSKNDLTFIITIPIWDKIGRKIMKYSYPEKLKIPVIEYDDFEGIQEIFKSKYFKTKLMIPKDKFTYLDHNFHLYKNVTIQHTYILVLSNTDIDFKSKLESYIFSNKKEIVV